MTEQQQQTFIQAQPFPLCNFASLTSHSYCFFFKKTLSENHVQLNLSHILFLRLSQKIGNEIILGSLLYGILSWITYQSAGNGPRITGDGYKVDNP